MHTPRQSPSELLAFDGELLFSGEEPYTPEEFIEKHEASLAKSIDGWQEIGKELQYFEGEVFIGATRRALAAMTHNAAAQDHLRTQLPRRKPGDRVALDSSQLAAEKFAQKVMGSVTVALRALSVCNSTQVEPGEFEEAITGLADVSGIAMRTMQFDPATNIGTRSSKVLKKMQSADYLTDVVLLDLSTRITEQPDFLDQLDAYFRQSHVKHDPLAMELRQMIAVDFDNPNPETSVLHTIINKGASQHPILLREAFLRATAKAHEDDIRLRRIQDMASYAIKFFGVETGDEISETAIMDNLRPSIGDARYDKELNTPFLEFVTRYIKDAEKILTKISNTTPKNSVRVHRTKEEGKDIREEEFSNYLTPRNNGAAEKRPKRRALSGRVKPSRHNVPTSKDIVALKSAAAEIQPDEPKLFSATYNSVTGSIDLTSMTAEEIIRKRTSLSNQENLRSDLETLLSAFMQSDNPKNAGAKKTTEQKNSRVTHNGKTLAVHGLSFNRYNSKQTVSDRKLSPSNDETWRWRIGVLFLEGNNIAVIDVLHHTDFDDKYGSSRG